MIDTKAGNPTGATSAQAVSGIRMNTLAPEDVQEAKDNAARMSAELTTAIRPSRIPNLTDLFENETETDVEQSGAFQGLIPASRTITQQAAQEQLPPAPAPADTGKDSRNATPEITYDGPSVIRPPAPVQGVVYPTHPIVHERPVAQLRSVSIPMAPREEIPQETGLPARLKPSTVAKPLQARPLSPVLPATPAPTAASLPVIKAAPKTAPAPAPMPVPVPEKPKSLWSRMSSKVSEKLSAAKEAVTGFVKKHKTGVTVAAVTSLAAATGAGVYAYQNNAANQPDNTDSTYQTVDTPAPTTSTTEAPAPVKAPKNIEAPVKKTVDKAPDAARKFAKNIENSKSPLIQDIITKGEAKLNGNILGSTMLQPFQGLANDAQRAELTKFQASINLGMGVFFNEHFGTAEKTAQSMKDPNLRNLYSTAKVMKEKGWAPASLTKDKYPEEYRLATRIFEDSRALGLDKTDNPDSKVQARVNGNMFQAKKNGDTLQLKKTDGSYHVVLETIFNIFDGKNVHDSLTAAVTPAQASGLNPSTNAAASQGLNNTPGTGAGTDAVIDAPQDGVSMPDAGPSDNGGGMTPATPTILQNNYNSPRLPESDVRMSADKELDDEWDAIGRAMDQLAAEKSMFEQDLSLEVEMSGGLSSRELHSQLIAAVGEKLAMLYPMANREQVIGMVKRFGYIGFHLVHADPATGKCQVKVYKNVYKILKEVLDKKAVRENRFS